MSKYSSDSNSRDRTRSYSRYYNKKHSHRSSSSSSAESSSRHSSRHHSSRSVSRHHKKSKRRHRSDSSSEYSSSRHKRSSRLYRKDESHSKRRKRSPSSSDESDHSNSSHKNNPKLSRVHNESEKNKTVPSHSTSNIQTNVSISKPVTPVKEQSTNWLQKNVYDVMKRENSIEQINQEGFVFKVFKPSSEHKGDDVESSNFDVPKLNEEIINLPIEDSAFLISNPKRLLSARYKLLTKQERRNNWAKHLLATYRTIIMDNN